MTAKLTTLAKRLLWPALFSAAFAIFFYLTFPGEQLARRLESEARAQGVELSIGDLKPWRLSGLAAKQVEVKPPAIATSSNEPVHILLDEVDARVNLLPLLWLHTNVDVSVFVWNGKATGTFSTTKELSALSLDVTDLDLVQAAPLRQLSGLELAGKISGKLKLSMDAKKGIPSATGRVDAKVAGGAITGGAIYGFPLKLAVGNVEAAMAIGNGDAKLEKLVTKGGDLESEGDGVLHIRPMLALSQLDAKIRFRPAQTWLDANPLAKAGMSMIASAREPDGFYSYRVAGSLSAPVPRPGK